MADGDETAGEGTKRCRECKGEMPVSATRCMHCGVSQRRVRHPVVWAVVVGIVGLVAIWAGGIWYAQHERDEQRDQRLRYDCMAEAIEDAGDGWTVEDCDT